MTRQPLGPFDGLTNAERGDLLYAYFSAASDVGGHLPPARSLARIFVRRRNLQVFTSGTGTSAVSILRADPALISARRRLRLMPGSGRRARQSAPRALARRTRSPAPRGRR